MAKNIDILKSANLYILKNNLDTTPELLFIEFSNKVKLHREFEAYLSNSKLILKLNIMKRGKMLLEKRRLFSEWYMLHNQNQKQIKEITYELSEMVFCSTRTVEKGLSAEATEK